ncbi:hypothetical protein E2986_04678 [Frieseomelitta varia]|uniref:CREG-like beta-barrel domain-containing protein n=1 Tax=Frieseomelitta varia TaxID=561572 RepID=A0A833RAV6_9HYME|nr:protein CREG1 [Frieseomelitta varia]KAF3425419.1 hypothetical protein E2986_04678 [Frieseomelitta varia]
MILRFAIFVAFLILTIEAKKYERFSEDEQWQEFEEYLKWKKAKEMRENHHDMYKSSEKEKQSPPPIDQAVLMARYIVNQADWVSVATFSIRKDIESFPAANLISYADGLLGNGSGVPYLYLTPLDFTAQDLAKDSRASLLMTLAQGDYCKNKKWDPMDPRCARILLSGKIVPLEKDEKTEIEFAKKVFFTRHPGLVNMPANHHFYFAKLRIFAIVVLDTFGGPKYLSIKDYLHPPATNITEEFNKRFPLELYEDKSQQEHSPISMFHPVIRV